MDIQELPPDGELFNKAIQLGNKNSSTLGFMPEGAYKENARRGQILIAFEGDQIMGYLFYNINNRGNFVYIVHLCVSEKFRRMGVSHELISELKARTRSLYRGIRVKCRRDYGIDQVWANENFLPKGDVPGRSKKTNTLLTFWWFDHGHPDLFSIAIDNLPFDSLITAMDANIFFDLQEEPNSHSQSSHALTADWLEGCITLCVTSELYNEINRNRDLKSRRKARRHAEQFHQLKASDEALDQQIRALRKFFPDTLTKSANSDLRQLAFSLVNSAEVFVTRDEKLLRLSKEIFSQFGMRILNPSALIVMQDSIVRESEYYPERYRGTLLSCSKVDLKDAGIEHRILAPQDEKVGKLRRVLNNCLADPRNCEVLKFHSEEDLHAVVAYQYKEDLLEIPIFRVLPNKTTGSLARHLLMQVCIESVKKGCSVIKVTDSYIPAQIERALSDLKFTFSEDWIKVSIPFVGSIKSFQKNLSGITCDVFPRNTTQNGILKNFERAVTENTLDVYPFERFFWPSKFSEVEIPTYLISIQPRWAMHLFHSDLASQDLFGGDPKLVFSLENAYYRSGRPNHYRAPARILWYVSKDSGSFRGTQAICACSYLDEIILDKPKVVYKALKKLGIYKWKDVLSVAKGDIGNEIMGLRFSHTELFSTSIDIQKLRVLWPRIEGKPFTPPQSPVEVSKNMFLEIYSIGQHVEKEKDA